MIHTEEGVDNNNTPYGVLNVHAHMLRQTGTGQWQACAVAFPWPSQFSGTLVQATLPRRGIHVLVCTYIHIRAAIASARPRAFVCLRRRSRSATLRCGDTAAVALCYILVASGPGLDPTQIELAWPARSMHAR